MDYDPMLAKIIATGADRDDARRRLRGALESTAVLGFTTNAEFLALLVELPDVAAGAMDTELIERALPELGFADATERHFAEAALLIHAAHPKPPLTGPWARADGWRFGTRAPSAYRLRTERGDSRTVQVWGSGDDCRVAVDGAEPVPASVTPSDSSVTVVIDGLARSFAAVAGPRAAEFADRGAVLRFVVDVAAQLGEDETDAAPQLTSPMPGTVVLIPVSDGAHVEEGDVVLVIEAMKMEHQLRASVAGTVSIHAAKGAHVKKDEVVVTITPEERGASS
jgi:acetyl-CoA/propionyl-CoA carboxylase biotin carboxyl carrier protein